MTNEELVALIQAGERDRMGELWQNVERFIWQQANLRVALGIDGVTAEDLCQSGYLALVDAANTYEPCKGKTFIGWLSIFLKNAFNAAAGLRSERQRRDPLHHAVSTDAPAYLDEVGPTVEELVPDESAALAFAVAECEDCRDVIAAALDSLPDGQGELLRRYYLRGEGIDTAAAVAGYASRYSAYQAVGSALYRLAHGKYTRALRACLDSFIELEEYSAAARSTSAGSYWRTGMSATEAGALR